MIARVMVNMGAIVRVWGMMYKAVAQSVILYNSERCILMGGVINVLDGFHHQVAKRITGMVATRGAGGDWEYPLVVAAMEAA